MRGAKTEALRIELRGLKLSALRKRATAAGADEADMDAVDDSDDPKRALVELVIAKAAAGGTDTPAVSASNKPHFGATAAKDTHTRGNGGGGDIKHVMLSYHWDHQVQVKRVYDILTKLGVHCWLDISGGMGKDIYESMAAGVSNACALVCFMSQKYQDSTNCTLEAKFVRCQDLSVSCAVVFGLGANRAVRATQSGEAIRCGDCPCDDGGRRVARHWVAWPTDCRCPVDTDDGPGWL